MCRLSGYNVWADFVRKRVYVLLNKSGNRGYGFRKEPVGNKRLSWYSVLGTSTLLQRFLASKASKLLQSNLASLMKEILRKVKLCIYDSKSQPGLFLHYS